MQNSQPLPLEEALQRLFSTLRPVAGTTTEKLTDSLDRILAEDVAAPVDLPPFPASAMDGYALRRDDLTSDPDRDFQIIAESLAGHPTRTPVGPDQCVRIFTGAMVPEGADQVILQEEVCATDGRTVRFNRHEPGESYVRPIGHDVSRGQLLAAAGSPVTALLCGALTAAGVNAVQVLRKVSIGVFSTGDELVDAGTPVEALQPGQIYDSNRLTVLSLLRHGPWQAYDLGRLPDDEPRVRAALADAARRFDVLITSGGVSVGDADFVTAAIRALGTLDFWRLNLKPGKPLAFGRIGDCHLFGLPGNPVSTIVTLLLLVKPALLWIAGGPQRHALRAPATLLEPLPHTPGRTEFQRGQLSWRDGKLLVSGTGDQSSNRLSTFQHANCLIEVPASAGDLATGDTVAILPFNGLLS